MAAEIQTVLRHHLRVQVEPIDVELDGTDGNLLFATLQSAFPGCSGLFYRNEKTNTKTLVKFDGQKFCPPEGDWTEREYFVQLGSRCAFPFGSYENASKQFERSVNLVSKLLNGKRGIYFDDRAVKRELHSPVERMDNIKFMVQNMANVKSEPPSTPPGTPLRIPSEDINHATALQRTAADLEASYSSLTPLEQQFVDLARISTAKDSIIESQRNELRELHEKLQAIKKKARETKEELERAEARCRAQDEELSMLRSLSKEQTYMCEQVSNLTKRLIDTKDENDRIVNDLNAKIDNEIQIRKSIEKENQEKDELIRNLNKELEHQRKERQEYIEKLGTMNFKLDQQSTEFAASSEEMANLQGELTAENTNLLEKNEALQSKCEELTQKCIEMESIWNQKIQEAIKTEVERNNILTEESRNQEKKIAELSSMVDQMARENSELVRRLERFGTFPDALDGYSLN
ncbi:hypothetical protein FO519_001864 [Halicephalobus sp. NKZ332]|nr:hypothetical protein FO519_001864 [Halicephalobus sp. NKZ332]